MAAEFIDDTENGSGLYPTKIPGYEDAADIQEALRLYHYGSTTIPTDNNLGTPNGINTKSVAGHLKSLSNADATHAAATTDVHGIDDTSLLATIAYVDSEISDAIDGATGGYSELAGIGIDWNSADSQFDVEPKIANIGTVITKTSAFTLDPLDVSKTILLSTDSNMNLTIPLNSSVSIPVGYQYHVIEIGSGITTFSPASGVTVNSKNSQLFIDAQYGKVTLMKVGENSWIAYGDIYEASSTPTPIAPTPTPTPTPVAPTPTPTAPIVDPVAPTPTPVAPTVDPVAPTVQPVTPTSPIVDPVAPTVQPVTPTAPTSLTTYYACCTNGAGVSGSYANSEDAVTGLNAACNADEPGIGNTTSGGVFTSPQSCNTNPTPTAPTPTASTTYYGCCSNGSSVSGSYSDSGSAATGLNTICANEEAGNTLSGGAYTTPQSCGGTPTPVAPVTPTAPTPTPVTPTAPVGPTPTPVAPVTPTAPVGPTPTPVAPVALTTYYACCTNGADVSGSYEDSSAAATGLSAACNANEPGIGNTVTGGVSTTPVNCGTTPTPVAPTPTPVAPTPVAPTAPPFFPFFPPFFPYFPFFPFFPPFFPFFPYFPYFAPVTPVAPVTPTAPTPDPTPVAPTASSTVYFCCTDGTSGSASSVSAATAYCVPYGGGPTGGVYDTPQNC